MTDSPHKAWQALQRRVQKMSVLQQIRGLLEWDQLTMMPANGAAPRGEQAALLATLHHELATDPEIGELLAILDKQPSTDPVKNAAIRNLRWHHSRAVKLPPSLVEAVEKARIQGHGAWLEARSCGDFSTFEPALSSMLGLTRQVAACLGSPGEAPYTALLNEYEPGTSLEQLEPIFSKLAEELRILLRHAAEVEQPPAQTFPMPIPQQRELVAGVVQSLGFDMKAGRLDTAVHPFTSGVHPQDVRITTRFHPQRLSTGLFAAIHECGHGLYEQGLPVEWSGNGVGQAASFGLHESQSRFWENFIGGSLPFVRWLCRTIERRSPGQAPSPDDFYAARNHIRPSLIRVEADEATYNLHILIRFQLEVALVNGDLLPHDLEGAWDDAYTNHLGVRPRDPVEGVLQDVHWSEGLFGYFPTYTLGNLYAASLTRALELAHPDLWPQVEQGNFSIPLDWMRQKIHHRGWLEPAWTLVGDAVGKRDVVEDLVSHLWRRHGALLGITRPPH